MSGSSAAAAYFTFHDVSINTYRYPMISTPVGTFTFHDVSINTTDSFIESLKLLALHSTMFLLIPQAETMLEQIRYTLHSTMFLLILLIAVCMLAGKYAYIPRCFYYTASLLIIEGSKHALHSTMFLLILDGNIIHDLNITFTFHDVSINTKNCANACKYSVFFTFHDVSINTIANAIVRIQNPALHSTMFLLILGRVLCVLAYGRPLHSTMFLLIRHSINRQRREPAGYEGDYTAYPSGRTEDPQLQRFIHARQRDTYCRNA